MTTGLPRPITGWSEHEELAERLAELRGRFEACHAEIEAGGGTADAASGAMARHLATVRPNDFPLAAETIWLERIVRPLKGQKNRPLSPAAIGMIRSWPSTRVADLVGALAAITAVLADAENDARNEVIYAQISHAYS